MTEQGRDPQENIEQIVGLARGQKGEPGQQGDQGDAGPGLTLGARQAVIFLFMLSLLLAGANLLWTAHQVHANQVAQQRAGQLVEQKLCTTLDELAALKPPPGNPHANPSRAYLQQEHDRLAQLGADLGCRLAVGQQEMQAGR